MEQTAHFERHAGKTSAILFVFVFLLIFGIFSWGLEYKLSLYQVERTQEPTIPAAKLLSQKERPKTQKNLSGIFDDTQQKVLATSSMLPIMLCVVFFCRLFLQTAKIVSSQDHSSSRRQRSYSYYFSFRPPPVFCA